MKAKLPVSCSLIAAALLIGGNLSAQESTEDLVRKLRGSAGDASGQGGSAPKTRGFTTRGISPRSIQPAAKPKAQERSVVFSTRGIPSSVKVAAEEDGVKFEETTGKKSDGAGDYSVSAGEKAVEVTYTVDPDSKVIRDNILFRKGSTDFADEASFNVVAELAKALKDPSLKDFRFVVEGHASAEGSAFANQQLSQRRADRIVTVLGSLGVNQGKLFAVGHGEQEARFPAGSEEFLLKQDRRVLVYRRVK